MENKVWEKGSEVWVAVRDEFGDIDDVESYMFVANTDRYVFACCFVYDVDSFHETMEYMIEQQREYNDPEFYAFPISDCYMTKEEALKDLSLDGE